MLLLNACVKRIKLTGGARTFYDLYWVFLTDEEEKLFRVLPDSKSIREFIDEFWRVRDPDPRTEENEFKIEVDERIEYADQHFRDISGPGHDSDRGRIYLLLGPPNEAREMHSIESQSGHAVLVWIYNRWGIGVYFLNRFGSGYYRLRYHDPALLQLLDEIKYEAVEPYYGDRDVRFIKPRIDYNRQQGSLAIRIDPKDLTFIREGERYRQELGIECFLHQGKSVKKVSHTETNIRTEAELLATEKIEIDVPLPELKGKFTARVILTDMISRRSIRRIVTFKAKK